MYHSGVLSALQGYSDTLQGFCDHSTNMIQNPLKRLWGVSLDANL